MASLATHLTASLLLCPVGLRRLICSSSLYLRNPSRYASRIWYFSEPNWRNVDLYALLIALPLASFSYALTFLSLSGNPTYGFSLLDQSLLVFFFWGILILIFFKETCNLNIIQDNFVFLFGGIGFAIEYYVTGRGMEGIAGEGYGNLRVLAALCAVCCFYLSIRQSSFFAEFLLSCGLMLKSTWVLQVGLSLYTDAFGLRGCDKISGVNIANVVVDVKCQLEDDMWRGLTLMNLLFVVHVVAVIMSSSVVFALLNQCRNVRFGDRDGYSIAEVGSESMLMHPHPEIEME